MSQNIDSAVTRRSAIRNTGAALAVGLGAAGAASATEHCPPCEEDPRRFCIEECVVTVEEAIGHHRCPFEEPSPVVELPVGITGRVVDECLYECRQAVLVDFCGELWWVQSAHLARSDRCPC